MNKQFFKLSLITFCTCAIAFSCSPDKQTGDKSEIKAKNTIEIPAATVVDKIRGGLLGQIIGNLNGLQHEFQYNDEPGDVSDFVPSLPEGAFTDDDTDFEWVYIYRMQQKNKMFLSSEEIADLWRESINERIWCSNQYARYLMDLGLEPPLSGNDELNPWATFNISGQFLCETFGLLGPAMPQTASKIGLNYTRVAIDGEPAQTTQLFCSMIATAFVENDIEKILAAGRAALDEKSEMLEVMDDIISWHKQYPDEWKKTRKLVQKKYTIDNGSMRDINGYALNGAGAIAALVYGQGDFIKTAEVAFSFGWDCDNNAATALTIIGAMKGYKWMMSQGWQIVDRYKNTTREGMPMDETITSFADRLVHLAEKNIIENGGEKSLIDGQAVYKIPQEKATTVYALKSNEDKKNEIKEQYGEEIKNHILNGGSKQELARAAYMAVCLNMADEFKSADNTKWEQAVVALNEYWKVMQRLFLTSEFSSMKKLQEKFDKTGLVKPTLHVADQKLWSIDELCFDPALFTGEKLHEQFKKKE